MRSWHPLSKMVVVLGLGGLAIVWWLESGAPGDARTAAADPSVSNETALASSSAAMSAVSSISPDVGHTTRALPPVAAFVSMVDRPLFAPARRPLDPELDVAELDLVPWTLEPAASPSYPTVDFIGSIEENGRVRALLGNGYNVRGVALGDTVEGWTVLAIDARRLTLGFDDEILELTILE